MDAVDYPTGEYAKGNTADAYILQDDPGAAGTNQFSYPKFRTPADDTSACATASGTARATSPGA